MRRTGLVLWRDLRAQGPLAAVAAVAALLPWVAPAVPGLDGMPAADVRQAGAALVAGLIAVSLAAVTGAGLLSRELAEGRLPFLLALPLNAWQVWVGKLLAACVLVYGAAGLALLGLGGGAFASLREAVLSLRLAGGAKEDVALAALLGLLAAAPLLLILLTHHLAVAVRCRSPWLLVDLGAIGLAGALVSWSLTRLYRALALTELAWGALVACATLALGLFAGGWAALARGGVVPVRFHRTQALTAAAALLLAAGAVGGWVRWTLTPGLGAVTAVEEAVAAPAGPWVLALARAGGRPSFTPWMLLGPGGRSLRLSAGLAGYGLKPPLDFSADGLAAVWLKPVRGAFDEEHELVWLGLDGAEPTQRSTGLVVSGRPLLALTSGGLLAVRDREGLRLFSERGRSSLAMASIPRSPLDVEALAFVGAELRLLAATPEALALTWRLAPPDWTATPSAARSLAESHEAEPGLVEAIELSPDGERAVLLQGFRRVGPVTLHDIRDGAQLARLDAGTNLQTRNVRFLGDGSVAVPRRRGPEVVLAIFSRDGVARRELAVGRGIGAELGGEWRPGRLLVSVAVGWRGHEARRELREVDLATGRWRSLHANLAPIASTSVRPGDPATRIFRDLRDRGLVELDPETGTLRQLLPLPPGRAPG